MKDETLIEPSPDEIKNGWSAATLTAYLTERAAARHGPMDWTRRPPARPTMANGKYSPSTFWRR